MQEDDDVADERIGDFLPEHDFEVAPKQLIGEPERHAESHQCPKKAGPTMIADEIGEERRSSREQENALGYITKNGEGKALGDQD